MQHSPYYNIGSPVKMQMQTTPDKGLGGCDGKGRLGDHLSLAASALAPPRQQSDYHLPAQCRQKMNVDTVYLKYIRVGKEWSPKIFFQREKYR